LAGAACGAQAFNDAFAVVGGAAAIGAGILALGGAPAIALSLPAAAVLCVTFAASGGMIAVGGALGQTSDEARALVHRPDGLHRGQLLFLPRGVGTVRNGVLRAPVAEVWTWTPRRTSTWRSAASPAPALRSREDIVNARARADGDDPKNARRTLGGIADPVTSNTVSPKPLELTAKRLGQPRVVAERIERTAHYALELAMQITNGLGCAGRDGKPKPALHFFERLRPLVPRSPNTSSTERALPPLAK